MSDRNARIIAESMAELDRIKAARLTDAQLATNIATFRNCRSPFNVQWLAACVDEMTRREASR